MSTYISEEEFREAIIATKKDAKLVAAAKNDRMNAPETLYREFVKLPLDRQKEIIASVANDYFVGAQWKVAFPVNNMPAAAAPDGVAAAGKALFFARDEDSLKETIRALKLYQESPYYKLLASGLAEAAEIVRTGLADVARILNNEEVYGLIKNLDPSSSVSEKLVQRIIKIAAYTRDLESTLDVAKFLHARRHSETIESVGKVIENAIFMVRDRKSVREIIAGLGSGAVDRVLQKHVNDQSVLSNIRDIAWKTRDSRAIRRYLEAI